MIKNKKILIIGASSDIGLSLIPYVNDESNLIGLHGFSTAERLYKFSSKNIRVFKQDLSNLQNGISLVEDFIGWAEGIDIFVQLSGIISNPVSWEDISYEDWNHDIAINLSIPFFMAREVIKKMPEGGRVLFTSTASAAHGGGANSIAYGSAKAGIEFITKALAKHCGKKGVYVNCICPGFIDTRIHSKAGKTQSDINDRINSIPLKKPGNTRDVAELIAFLVSEANGYVTGQCITIDGGDFI